MQSSFLPCFVVTDAVKEYRGFYAPASIDRGILFMVCPFIQLSQNLNLASKIHTVWRIFLKLGMHVACDDFNVLYILRSLGQRLRSLGVMVKVTFITWLPRAKLHFFQMVYPSPTSKYKCFMWWVLHLIKGQDNRGNAARGGGALCYANL